MSIIKSFFIGSRIYIFYIILYAVVYFLSGCGSSLRPYVPVDKAYSLRSPDFIRWTRSSPL